MKKIQLSIAAIAALAGVTGALAFAPHKTTGNIIFVKLASGQYHYSDNTPSGSCAFNSSTACSFTSTATASYFTGISSYQTQFPSTQDHNGTEPQIAVTTTNKIWQ